MNIWEYPAKQAGQPVSSRLEVWQQDLAFAVRALRHAPALVIGVIAALTLGLGVNGAVLSLVDEILFRPPAGVQNPANLRRLWVEQSAGVGAGRYFTRAIPYHEYRAIASALADHAQVALYGVRRDARIGQSDNPVLKTVAYTTANYFAALGVRMARGRSYDEQETAVGRPHQVVVVSDAFWRRELGGTPGALGQQLVIDDVAYVVIGVAPPSFRGVDASPVDLWLPLSTFPTRETARVSFWDSSVITFDVFARVRSGEVGAVESRASTAYRLAPVTDFAPDSSASVRLTSIIEARGAGERGPGVSLALRLTIVALLVLCITIANVMNLLLARAAVRRREMALRLALGASRMRLLRPVILEAVLLALVAGILAVVCSQLVTVSFRRLLFPDVSSDARSVDLKLVGVMLALSVAAGAVTALGPALQAGRADAPSILGSSGRGVSRRASWLSSGLVGLQAAFSVALLTIAAAFVLSARNVSRLDLGLSLDEVALASIQLPAGERADTAGFAVSMRNVAGRVAHLPSVRAVGLSRDEPVHGMSGRVSLFSDNDSSEAPGLIPPTANYVSSTYFDAVGLAFEAGRSFRDEPALAASSVVVNAAAARVLWPSETAVGRCLYLQQRASACLTVVGVVRNAIRESVLEPPSPQIYLPIFASMRGQRPPTTMVIRAQAKVLPLVLGQAANLLHDEFPRGQAHGVLMKDRLAAQYWPWRLGASLFTVFGCLALLVAAFGIFSMISYAVSERTPELGIRVALGAQQGDVVRQVMAWGIVPTLAGAIVGVILAVASQGVLHAMLYGVGPGNPLVVAMVLSLVSLFAGAVCLPPAVRAARVDPLTVISSR